MMRFLAAVTFVFAVFTAVPGLSAGRESAAPEGEALSGDLIIFHAGSLSVPFREIAAAFSKEHPEVNVMREAAGSRTTARKVSDLGKPCDVLSSADYTVIENLLIPDHAGWCIKFATNEMVIVCAEGARRGEEITTQNWYEILAEEDVALGRSDPDMDPCGYRAVLCMKLAERHYGATGLADRLLTKDLSYVRPKETDLLALLEVNQVDYIFLYRSVAQQHGLKYLVLPDEVNLKNPALADLYGQVSVEISGKQPRSFITKQGGPMIYGVTIPDNAPNREAAMAFVSFLLDRNKGLAIVERNGQESVVPSATATFDKIPEPLKGFAVRAR
ncbi:MAG: extracellular solute-binding protein [Planctomycetota bacterium]|jgi:molybdate/tungstate transport system substrate-binding protein